ncbi:MAG TPA: PAC2 family protein [Acidimicrobiales bacterium]|jgi:predicted ATP-grasp superfamily ATP-dependent carboligase|nr:PAC2 family protein [Acidimicrobiales bacterium]
MDAASDLYELRARPELDSPVLVMAPEGWIDAGLGGAGAVGALLNVMETEVVAAFDADRLLDHRARRPVSHIVDGVYTDLVWPKIDLLAGHDADGRGVLVLAGPEPDHEWAAFARAVAELAQMFGVRMVVGLGAFPAGVPHTRTARLAATASTAELANQVGVVSGTVEVPAGILAAIERELAPAGVPTVGIWARVPHYAASMPYPPASVQLLEGLTAIAGIRVEVPELVEAAEATRQHLDELTANSVQHMALVRQLEAQVDSENGGGPEAGVPSGEGLGPAGEGQREATAAGWGTLPTGDELAAEVERFLREEPS